ncbi:MAG: ABC transporter permease [Myxococcales bacterium]|nr:ABC transporter permease [Myxococcales bacterium]
MRSLLTTLGVVIGVAAVIVMQAMGAGTTELVTAEISSFGSNMLVVVPGGDGGMFGGSLLSAPLFSDADLEAITRECDAVRYVSASGTRSVRVVKGEKSHSTTLSGVSPAYFAIREWSTDAGRALNEDDERQAAKRCVIGHTVATELFGGQDPLDQEFRLHDFTCTVVGVAEAKGTSAFGMDQDDLVFLPHSTFNRRILGDTKIGSIIISTVSAERTDEAIQQLQSLMRQRRRIRPGDEDDFRVRDMREVQEMLGNVTGVLTTLLAGVAAISLIVGGIGIMNIMLVSVTERTREIGVRMAVGARSRDILQQFLIEAMVLSSLGGLLGVLIGTGLSVVVSRALELPLMLPFKAMLIAFAFSLLVGVIFGVFPARKAARLRPIEALRYE